MYFCKNLDFWIRDKSVQDHINDYANNSGNLSEKKIIGEIDYDLLRIKNNKSNDPMSLQEYKNYIDRLFFK